MSGYEKLKKSIEELLSFSEELKENLIAVYLFGSEAEGLAGATSDVDLAFVFNEPFYRSEPVGVFNKVEVFSYELGRFIGRSVDPVILNASSLKFAYHIIKTGILVYEKDVSSRVVYEIRVENEYLDFKPFLKELAVLKGNVE